MMGADSKGENMIITRYGIPPISYSALLSLLHYCFKEIMMSVTLAFYSKGCQRNGKNGIAEHDKSGMDMLKLSW